MLFPFETWKKEWVLGCALAAMKLEKSKQSSFRYQFQSQPEKKKELVEPLLHDSDSHEDHQS